MSTSYIRLPVGGVATYTTFSAFPVTAPNGTLALALDTDFLYAYNTVSVMWVLIAGAGSIISMGTFDSGTPAANGAHIDLDQLIMQSASASNPGVVNTGSQILAGVKTFNSAPILNSLTASTGLQLNSGKSIVSAILGTVTESTSSVLTLSGWSNATFGSPTIQVKLAGAAQSGYLSSTDWNTFNNKQPTGSYVTAISINSTNGFTGSSSGGTTPALTLSTTITGLLQGNGTAISAYTGGNLTDAGTDGIVITGGAGAVIGAGTSIAQHVADSTHNGYLSSTDWSTFNGKQAAGNYITALTGDVTATGPGSVTATLATVNSNVGSFGTASSVGSFTVNAKGLITAASNTSIQIAESQVTNLVSDLAGKQAGPLTGDVTTSGAAATLATVNGNVGSFTNANITVNAKGLITAASNGSSGSTSTNAGYYTSTTGTANSGTPFNFDTQIYDTGSNVTTGAAWKFTASSAGYYHVSGYISTSSITAAGIILYKNGVAFQVMGVDLAVQFATYTGTISLAINDYIDLRTSNTSLNWTGGGLSSTSACTIFIDKVG